METAKGGSGEGKGHDGNKRKRFLRREGKERVRGSESVCQKQLLQPHAVAPVGLGACLLMGLREGSTTLGITLHT